jgi:predicted AAA+ superfamily ATPase
MRALFRDDPAFQIESRAKPSLILDEAQFVPEALSAPRGLIDVRRRENGRFILLGSVQPSLTKGVSESLAGRVGAPPAERHERRGAPLAPHPRSELGDLRSGGP